MFLSLVYVPLPLVSGKIVLILKTNIGDQNFPSGDQKFWFVFRCEGKILLTLFGDHIFPCGDWKEFQSPVGACLKKINLGPCDSDMVDGVKRSTEVKED